MENIYESAIWKLTLWYMALVVAISLAFSFVVYHFAADAFEWGLHQQTARIYQTYPVFTNDPFFLRRDDANATSRIIVRDLVYFNLVVVIGAGFASYWLARRTLRPIEASNETQKQFVADASHELRTPITSLKMSTEVALMDEAATKSDLRKALDSNLEDANKLESLLNSLLQLSRLESNGNQLAMTSLPVGAIVDAAINQTKEQAAAKHIILKQETAADSILGDDASLTQLLVILLDNAIKYSPEHTKVTIGSKRSNDRILVTVSDQGMGIEPTALDHVFDRFYRADKARTGSNGYGLGLSIAKHIADLHHATITLKSTAGKGTTAIVSVPATDGR